jgi:hypothetical protein
MPRLRPTTTMSAPPPITPTAFASTPLPHDDQGIADRAADRRVADADLLGHVDAALTTKSTS